MAKDIPNREGADVYPQPERTDPLSSKVEVAPKAIAPASPDAKTASPEEHAKALGAVKTVTRTARVNSEPETFELHHWQHSAASALHGWDLHAHHEGKPIQISLDDYKAALLAASNPVTRALAKDGAAGEPIDSHEAAAKGVPVATDYEPHKPALSQHKDKSK
jgi:hypothetical protein